MIRSDLEHTHLMESGEKGSCSETRWHRSPANGANAFEACLTRVLWVE